MNGQPRSSLRARLLFGQTAPPIRETQHHQSRPPEEPAGRPVAAKTDLQVALEQKHGGHNRQPQLNPLPPLHVSLLLRRPIEAPQRPASPLLELLEFVSAARVKLACGELHPRAPPTYRSRYCRRSRAHLLDRMALLTACGDSLAGTIHGTVARRAPIGGAGFYPRCPRRLCPAWATLLLRACADRR